MELADFDYAHIAGSDAGNGLIVIDEIRRALEDVIGFGIFGMLMPANACPGRENYLCVHTAVAEHFILGYNVVNIRRALAAGEVFNDLDISFTDHNFASNNLIITVYRMGGGL